MVERVNKVLIKWFINQGFLENSNMPVDVMTYVKGFIAAVFSLIIIIVLIPVYAARVNEIAVQLDPAQAAILKATVLLIMVMVFLGVFIILL